MTFSGDLSAFNDIKMFKRGDLFRIKEHIARWQYADELETLSEKPNVNIVPGTIAEWLRPAKDQNWYNCQMCWLPELKAFCRIPLKMLEKI